MNKLPLLLLLLLLLLIPGLCLASTQSTRQSEVVQTFAADAISPGCYQLYQAALTRSPLSSMTIRTAYQPERASGFVIDAWHRPGQQPFSGDFRGQAGDLRFGSLYGNRRRGTVSALAASPDGQELLLQLDSLALGTQRRAVYFHAEQPVKAFRIPCPDSL